MGWYVALDCSSWRGSVARRTTSVVLMDSGCSGSERFYRDPQSRIKGLRIVRACSPADFVSRELPKGRRRPLPTSALAPQIGISVIVEFSWCSDETASCKISLFLVLVSILSPSPFANISRLVQIPVSFQTLFALFKNTLCLIGSPILSKGTEFGSRGLRSRFRLTI